MADPNVITIEFRSKPGDEGAGGKEKAPGPSSPGVGALPSESERAAARTEAAVLDLSKLLTEREEDAARNRAIDVERDRAARLQTPTALAGPGPGTPGGFDFTPPAGRGEPQPVELTEKNLTDLSRKLAGELSAEKLRENPDLDAAILGSPEKPATPPEPAGFDFAPEREKGVFKADGSFDFSSADKPPPPPPPGPAGGFEPFDFRRPDPTAQRIPTAQPAVPEGGDADVQKALQEQHNRGVETAKRAAAKEKAAAETAAKAAEQEEAAAKAAKMAQMRTIAGGAQTMAASGGSAGGLVSGLSQIAGTGALGEAAMAIAQPEVAAAMIAAEAIKGIIALPYQAVREKIDALGHAAEKVATNDLGGLLSDASEAVSSHLENAGIVGMLMAEELRTVTAAVKTFRAVVDAFNERGRQLAGFDPNLANATAMVDVQKLTDDIREAQATGPELAKLMKSTGDIDSLGREILLFLKMEIIPALNEVVEPMGDIARDVKPILKELTGAHGDVSILATLVRGLPPVLFLRVLSKLLRFLDDPRKALMGGDEEKAGSNPLLDEVFAAARNVPIGTTVTPQQSNPPAEQAVGMPTFFAGGRV